jgi:hypothetical protein
MGSRQRPRWGTGPAPTHRDVAALAWIADQYAVRADTLGVLLGRLSPEQPRNVYCWEFTPGEHVQVPVLAEATVRYHLRRWHRARWVRVQRALGRTWIVPSRGGLDLAGSGYRPWTLVPSQLQHLHAVAVVRLAIEGANPAAEWVSERELTRLRAQTKGSWWRPDGGLVVADAAVNGSCPPLHTIEVELTPSTSPGCSRSSRTATRARSRPPTWPHPATSTDCGAVSL